MKILLDLFCALLLFLPAAALANQHAINIAEHAEIGKYLTDAEGKTLYWFKLDAPGKSACAGPCVDKWPLFYRESVVTPEGVGAADFDTLTRDDGQKQTTFRGYPLYYWSGDAKPGDAKGQGIKDVWFVVDPGNFPAK